MKVTTSDNKTIDNFEGFLSVVGTIQKAINPTQSKQNIGSSFSKLTMGSEYSSISSSSSGLTTPTQLLANRRALIESELISQKPLSGSATKETIESVLVSGLIKKVLTPLKKERVESLTMELIKEETFEKIRIYFPKSRGMPRVDDLRVVS
ncbi:MAG: hypothetical protein LBI81_03910, partial [Puniceicoccales bacterium]|nr:hypothetical protein [Puniceicoccales bacterium]